MSEHDEELHAMIDADLGAKAVNEQRRCGACGRPLGLYYAECLTCFAHAEDYREEAKP